MEFQNTLCSAWNTTQAGSHKLNRLSNICSGYSPLRCETNNQELPVEGKSHWYSFALSLKKLTAGRSESHSPPLGHMPTSHETEWLLQNPWIEASTTKLIPQTWAWDIWSLLSLSVYMKTNSLNWLESVWSKIPRTGLKPQHKTVLDWNGILPSLKGCLLWDKWSSHDHYLHFGEIQKFALLERSTRLHKEELRERKSYIHWGNAQS